MWSGVALIAVGVILICVQIWLQVTVPACQAPSRSLGVEGLGAKASVQTTYVGLVLVVLGDFWRSLATSARDHVRRPSVTSGENETQPNLGFSPRPAAAVDTGR
jgi:hypothetical protein